MSVLPRHSVKNSRQWKLHRKQGTLRFESLESRQLLAADIVGSVVQDVNGDGYRDFDEDGQSGWTVYLDTNLNGTLDAGESSQLTDADGAYAFNGIPAGDYRVAEVVRSGWTPTAPTTGYLDVTAVDGEATRADFLNEGNVGTASITGTVWRDLNNDGMRDPVVDTGVIGWVIYLDLNTDRVQDPEEPTAVTDGDGNYEFVGLLGGAPDDALDYEIVQVLVPGWEAAPGTSDSYTVKGIDGQNTVAPDFANAPVEISSISGNVWNDANSNGLRDGGESGLNNWTVFSDRNANGAIDLGEPTTTTSATGSYSLAFLNPGTHRIAVVKQGDFELTAPASGVRVVNAPADGSVNNVNFGAMQRTDAALGGVIYVDRNENGVRDIGEEGLSGIVVYLDANNNGALDTGELSTTTSEDLFYTPAIDEAGIWRFDHLAGGTYVIRQIVPAELSSTPPSEREHIVDISSTGDKSDIDSGDVYRPTEIHGVKFEDLNGNGLRDTGEPGLPGVTIYLDKNRNNIVDTGEPTTLTGADGSYWFMDLESESYVIREIVPGGFEQTFPDTVGGTLWPDGVSNPAVGNVTPDLIQFYLSKGETQTETVSLTLPTSGALTDMVDVFLLFDDTGSFTANSPIVRAAFPDIIAELQTQLPGIDLGFGTGRLEEYGNFAAEYSTGRPFILNQPIISSSAAGYTDAEVLASIQAGLDRVAPGYGGDRPETVIEALFQMVTGAGFDGNDNGSVLDSGPAGQASTQVNPGNSGDVPSFASFTADLANGVLPSSGAIGGAGFRSGALPIIITATDTGFAYQPKGETTITGIDGLTLPVTQITHNGRGTTPFNSGAGIQETVTGLNALGALVIGLGVNDAPTQDPRIGLEALANLTGAINRTTGTIANGTTDAIAPGDPLYFKIGTGGDPLVLNIADGIVAAIEGAVTAVNVNVTLRASDPRVLITHTPGVINGLGAGDTATFDVTFTGDGAPRRFDLQFVREGTDVVLGSIPVVIGTPIIGDGYDFEECEDGEICLDVDFANHRIGDPINHAPTAGDHGYAIDVDVPLSVVAPGVLVNDDDVDGDALTAIVGTGTAHGTLALAADGSFSYTPNAGYVGADSFTYVANDGALDSNVATVTITVNAVNDAPVALDDVYTTDEDTPLAIAAAGVLANDTDADGDALTAAIGTGPANGTLVLNADGSFTYTPNADFNGTDSFTYVANDGALDSNVATVTITVNAVNDAPVGVPTITGTAQRGQLLTADTSGISDADGLGIFSYQWLRNGVAIGGAVAGTYMLGDPDVGTQISVQVSYVDGQGTNEGLLTSAPITVQSQAGITVTPTSLVTTEVGLAQTFQISLDTAPTAEVRLPISSSDTTEGAVDVTEVVFSAGATGPITVTVTPVDDFLAGSLDGDIVYAIITGAAISSDASYSGLNAADVTVTNQDNDVAIQERVYAELTGSLITGSESGGGILATHEAYAVDSSEQVLTEAAVAVTGGRKPKLGSALEYQWSFSGLSDATTFHVDAYQSTGADDNFRFEYSTNNGSNWNVLETINQTTAYQNLTVNNLSLTGDVLVRVVDTDRSPAKGKSTPILDSVTIDHMYIEKLQEDLRPAVTITATDGAAVENPAETGVFRFERSEASANPLEVSYAISGTATNGADYVLLTETVTIPASATFVDLVVTPLDDSEPEGPQTVVLTLVEQPLYRLSGSNGSATVTITDDDLITFTATSESTVSGSITANSYTATFDAGGAVETIQEKTSGGKRANRTSLMDHRWTFSGVSGAQSFYLLASRSENSEGDNFLFSYSTDNGGSWTELVTVDSSTLTLYPVPLTSVSGTVIVRVMDTDRTQGFSSRDTINVDHMYFSTAPLSGLVLDTEHAANPAALSHRLGSAQFEGSVQTAIQHWSALEPSAQVTQQLASTRFELQPIAGSYLGLAFPQQNRIVIDTNGAGFGWSQVSLHDTLVHEIGHLYGYDHDVLGDSLALQPANDVLEVINSMNRPAAAPLVPLFDEAIEQLTRTREDTRLDLPTLIISFEAGDDARRLPASVRSHTVRDEARDLNLEAAISDLFGEDESADGLI